MTNSDNRLDRIEASLERTELQTAKNSQAIATLTAKMDQAIQERAELRADAEADRKMIVATLEHLDTVHAENQRILNYLFSQQRNGHNGDPT